MNDDQKSVMLRQEAIKIYSVENYDFIVQFNKLKSKQKKTMNLLNMTKLEKLYSNFIKSGAPNEINIDFDLRDALAIALQLYRTSQNEIFLCEDIFNLSDKGLLLMEVPSKKVEMLLEKCVVVAKNLLMTNIVLRKPELFG